MSGGNEPGCAGPSISFVQHFLRPAAQSPLARPRPEWTPIPESVLNKEKQTQDAEEQDSEDEDDDSEDDEAGESNYQLKSEL